MEVRPSGSPHDLKGPEALTAVAAASTVDAMANTVLPLVCARLQAEEARVVLFDERRQSRTSWSSRGLDENTPDPWQAFLGPLSEACRESARVVTDEGSARGQSLLWISVPVLDGDSCIGSLLGGFTPGTTEPNTADRLMCWATILAVKVKELKASARARHDQIRSNGWFRTMDSQIRILERERQKLSSLVNQSDAAVFVARHDGSLSWVNAAMAARYGNGDASSLAHGGCRVICGANGTPCGDCPVRTVTGSSEMLHQERTETRDGELRHLYLSAFPIRTPEGAVDEVMVMIQDLTDLETLRRSEARYHRLFERSADAMVMADPATLDIVMANRAARVLLGLGQAIEPGTSVLSVHPERTRAEMRERYGRLREGTPLENVEVEVLAGDGSTLTCNACGGLFDLDGTDAVLVEFRDVTQVRKLQAELARADHLITLGTMNAGIAHEFKNRLAPLRAFAQLITMRAPSQEKLQTYSPMIIQEIDRLTVLVKDILDYARPQDPQQQTIDLAEVVRGLAAEFVREFRHTMKETEVHCTADIASEPIPVIADEEQIRRVFLNLFKNSLEAGSSCDRDATIRIAVTARGDRAVVRLEDTGCGMSETTLNRIFDPFFTTKGPRGTGLGMCIVKSLIEANDGTITVTSRAEEGTRVDLSFPIREPGRIPETSSRDAA